MVKLMDTDKVASAVAAIKVAKDRFGSGLFLGHSGGKDSAVILHLTTQVIKAHEITIVHNVKPMIDAAEDEVAALTAMHPPTLEYLYTQVCTKHEVQFMHSNKMKNWLLKNMLRCQVDGARRSEWDRPGKSSEIIVDGEKVSRKEMPQFVEKGIFDLSIVYPIYNWTDTDVFDYLYENQIPFSKEYQQNGEWDKYWENRLYREAW